MLLRLRRAVRGRKRRSGAASGAGRELLAAIEAAGGRVSFTAKGHIRVVGPAGICVTGLPHKNDDWRVVQNRRSSLRRYAGIELP